MTLLSKSKYLAGCQCPRRLWLGSFAPELAAPRDRAGEARLVLATEIGRHAYNLFPGGVLVDEEAWRHGEAIARTGALVANPAVPAIFEAAFVHRGVRVRVDVLERLPDGAWGLREVKSGTHVRAVHLHDAAVQRVVLEGCGLRVPSVEIVHLDAGYVRGDGDIEWPRLFTRVDVTAKVEKLLPDVPQRIEVLHHILASPEPAAIEPDGHCFSPYACEFWAHCTREKPADWVFHLPGRPSRFAALCAAGIERIPDIPDDFALPFMQARARDALRSGQEFLSPDLALALASMTPPTAYLDFETMNPPFPLYPGTRPYEQVPFQWSLHEIDATGSIRHREWLADGRSDPRREFGEQLLAALGDGHEPVVVYSGFEGRVLSQLSSALPDLAPALDTLRGRLVDLLPLVRRHVYHPAFGGSFSLKSVAPALVDGFGYDDLATDIAGGSEASVAFLRLASGLVTDVEEESRLRHALRAYCERDTLALVEVHRALRARMCPGAGRPDRIANSDSDHTEENHKELSPRKTDDHE